MTATEIVTRPMNEIARADDEWSVERIIQQTQKIQQCMAAVMKPNEHYGIIPGTSRKDKDGKELAKPTLLKPGAEKLCLMFRLCPEYETIRAEQTSALVAYTIRCRLTHITTGNLIATGLGSCNSREKKYTRPADKKCPQCGKETIIKGKEEFGGGWVCFTKKGGCNSKFKDGDTTIEQQDNGVADPSDLDNTILKMACKRALVAAVLNGTAASDFFTQDLEDLAEKAAEYTPPVADEVQRSPATGAPVGGNVPVPSKAGRGSWPKEQGEHAADKGMREMDRDYARTVNGHAPSDLEATLQRSIDANTIEVVDAKTGEVTQEPKATAAQLKKIRAMCNEMNISDSARKAGMLKYYKTNSSTLLTKAQAQDMIDRMEIVQKKLQNAHDSVTADMAAFAEDRGDVPDPSEMEPV